MLGNAFPVHHSSKSFADCRRSSAYRSSGLQRRANVRESCNTCESDTRESGDTPKSSGIHKSSALFTDHRKPFGPNGVWQALLLISCLLGPARSEHLNPLKQNLCSDYLLENLISGSVTTFKQLWLTNDRVSAADRSRLTFITYLDNWLRRDGAPNVQEEIQTLACSDFGKMEVICKFELEFLQIKHMLFDGIHLYIFLQNQKNRIWRAIVVEARTGSVLLFDSFTNCEKRMKRKKVAFYKRLFCILHQHMDMNEVKDLLMMNIDMRAAVERSSFEIWYFFRNQTMGKIRFPDREGKYQIINLKMSSPADFVTVASVQFVLNRFQLVNSSVDNPFAQRTKRSVGRRLNEPVNSTADTNSLIGHHRFSGEPSRLKRSPSEHYHLHFHPESALDPNRLPRQRRPKKQRKRKHRKHRKRPKKADNYSNELAFDRNVIDARRTAEDGKSKKSIDSHLRRLVNGLSAYLSSFNLTLDTALNKLKEFKAKAFSSLFVFRQNEVVLFQKYYATFHTIESSFFVQPAQLPYVQPNQVYLGCPQPFCFLTTIDDLTFNPLTNELLIFRNQYYWSIRVDVRRTNPRLPHIQIDYPNILNARLIGSDPASGQTGSNFPQEFPMYIDAATFVIVDNFYYLLAIKDSWIYVYIEQSRRVVPLLMTDYFDEHMTLSRVDAMFFQNRQLFVFSENNYWLYDLLDSFKLRFNNRGVMFRNLPGSLDAAFVLNNRFYFFKQNFFYLNDAAGNSLINPQLVHDTFLVGCDKSRLPRDVNMNRLFRAPPLINFYCMRCPGYIVDRMMDKWNVNNNTFVTVRPPPDGFGADERTNKGNKVDDRDRSKSGKNLNVPGGGPIPPIFPIDRSSESPFDSVTENEEDDKIAEPGLVGKLNRLNEFALDSWHFLMHHLLFGFLLLLGILFMIYLCHRGREAFLPLDDRPDEELLRRKGRARRREMRRRNRRWN